MKSKENIYSLKILGLFLLVIIILVLIFLGCYVENKGVYIFPGDSVEQMYQFYLGGWERIHAGTLSQFDWSLGVGGNIMAYVYYFLTSPFFYITLFFPREGMQYLMLNLNSLKIFLLFISTYYWASKITGNKNSKIIASFIITFSGWVFFYYAYNMFLDAFILYPLILGLTEEYLKNNKYVALTCCIGILGIINYYFLYMFLPFLCVYALIRYVNVNQLGFNFKLMIKVGLKFAGIILLGICLSAVILLPCGFLVMQNNRFMTNEISYFDTIGINEIVYFFSTLFTPVFERFNASYLIPEHTHEFIGWGGGCSLFAFIIKPLLLPLVFCLKDKYKRNSLVISYCMLLLLLNFQYGWYLLQRSIDTRWLYMFLFVDALALIEINEELEDKRLNSRKLIFSFMISGSVIAVLLLNMLYHHYWPRKQMIEVGVVSVLMIIFMMCYVVYYNSRKKETWFLLTILTLEAIASGRIFVAYNYGIDHTFFEQPEQSTEAIEYIKRIDHGYYRILYGSESYQIPGAPGAFVITTPNEPFSKNYPGFSFYNTIYNTETSDYYNRTSPNWFVSEAMGRNKIYNLLSAKYWITYDYESQIPDDYELLYKDKDTGFSIYKNPYFLELGKTYDKTINKEFFDSLPVLLKDRIMLDYLVTEESTNFEYELNDNFIFLGQLPECSTRELVLEDPISNGNLYVVNYGVTEIIISLYNDNELLKVYPYSQYNYVDLRIDDNMEVNRIVVEGGNYSGVAAFMDVYFEPNDGSYDQWYQQTQKEKFENVLFNNDYIAADINLTDERYIFTSIPYDKGWKVYVNGEKVPYEKVNLGFIGLRLGSGNYHLEFRYEIPYLKVGAIISLGSLMILILLSMRNSKKRKLKK